jgi:hypothetical protein
VRPTQNLYNPSRAHTSSIKVVSAWYALLALGYALLVSWLDPALPWPVTFTSMRPWGLVFLNLVPVLLLHAALLIVTRRLLLASWLTVLAVGALYFINYVKLRELATPLLPDDFRFLKAIGVNYAFFAHYLASSRLQLLFAVTVLAITLMFYRERPMSMLNGGVRWGAAFCTLVLWASLVQGSAPWRTMYNPGDLQFEPWAPLDSASRTGLITNMLLLHWELRDASQPTPDVQASKRLLHEHGLAAAPAVIPARTPLPDIIVVQAESLFDITRLNGVEIDVMPNMRAAAKRAWSGDLLVPTFGGGTIRTEFEVLTGLPLSAFPQVRYPYLQLTRNEIPSIVWELRSNGYRTLALHPNGGAFWNRNYAFRAMGFERFIDADGFKDAERHGWYVSDAALVDRVIAELRDYDDEAPQMIMAISIQDHGPYDTVPLPASGSAEPLPSQLNADAALALDTYIKLVRATDEALGRLMEFVEHRQRDTLLLIYSDHLPPLNAVYAQLGFRDARRPDEQPVPWLLIDNRSSEPRLQHGPSWMLPTLLVEKTGVSTSRYFATLTNGGFADMQASVPPEVLTTLAHLQFAGQLENALTDGET